MKKLALLTCLFPMYLFANPFLTKLMDVNKGWKQNQDGILLIENGMAQPNKDLIISHLMLVERVLRNRPVNNLTENQRINRVKYLDILNRYWNIGKVPTNDYLLGRIPVFIDREDVHCAVGYLLQQGGFENIARKIDEQNKFVYALDIKTPELFLWQKECGLTLEELAWIQPTYAYPGSANSFGSGLKGEVRDIKSATGKYSLIAAGKFKIEGDTNYVVLSGWDGKVWTSIISASSGIVNKIEVKGNSITSYGGDISFGNFNKVEILETDISDSQPSHKLKGELNGIITDFEVYKGKSYICGKFTGGLAVRDTGDWIVIPSVEIDTPSSIRAYNGKLYITGKLISKGVYALVSYDGTNFLYNDYLPKQANYLHVYGDKMFIGLKSNRSTDTLLYTLNNTELAKFDSLEFLFGREIRNIISRDNKLVITGDFSIGSFYYGSGLALFNRNNLKKSNIVININGIVNSGIINLDKTISIGGDFTSYQNFVGNSQGIRSPIYGCATAFEERFIGSVNQIIYEKITQPYPNPTSGPLFIPESGQLLDLNGKMIMILEKGENDISALAAGVYIYVNVKENSRILKE